VSKKRGSLQCDAAGNLLTQVDARSSAICTNYDGDGNRVKSVIGSTKTYYIANYYEFITSGGNSTIKKYYYLAGQLVCMRNNGTQKWLLSDHLGSMAVTANNVGAWEGESRYRPYGKVRGTFPALASFAQLTSLQLVLAY
jgi:YD repeat-containing protein